MVGGDTISRISRTDNASAPSVRRELTVSQLRSPLDDVNHDPKKSILPSESTWESTDLLVRSSLLDNCFPTRVSE